MKEELTLSQLRLLTLESQGLTTPFPFGKDKDGTLAALEHLGYLQIDTLSIVERAHHHTLWTRLPDYQTGFLDALVEERKVFEYWFHAASYLPMRDFRFVLPQMLDIKQNGTRYYNADPKVMQYVLDTIRAEGPKRARDFENETKRAGSWWSWKPTKLALERLFMQGDLMVSGRNGMQKMYDVTERVLPASIDTAVPTRLEFAQYLVKTYLKAYGFTTLKQVTHLKTDKLLNKNVVEVLQSMVLDGSVRQVSLGSLPPVFVDNGLLERSQDKAVPTVRLLSPFDNAIIHRDRVRQLFDFDFRLECYLPREKREYGYFSLPILFGDTFIGRVDCKAHRKEKVFELIHLHIENTAISPELWMEPFIASVKSFATFNNCETLLLTRVTPAGLTDAIKQLL